MPAGQASIDACASDFVAFSLSEFRFLDSVPMINLVVLGSGTSVPHPERAATSHWLETETGSLLLDVSAAAIHRLAQENLDWVNLDAIWISHFHLDHVGGLAPFLFGMKHAPQTRGRRKPLMIYGGYGLKKMVRAFF